MKKRNKTLIAISSLIAIGFFLLLLITGGKHIDVNTKINAGSFLIGEKIELTYDVSCPGNLEFEFPQIEEKVKGLTLNDSSVSKKTVFNRNFITFVFKFYTFETGDYEFPELTLKFITSDKKTSKEINTEKKKIIVKSLLNKDDASEAALDIKDIKGPLPAHINLALLAMNILIVLIVAAIAVFFYIKNKRKQVMVQKPIIPAHVIALEKLNILRKQDLISRGMIKEFYFRLSLIIRQYLEDRFRLRAPEMTTEEFLNHLKDSQTLSIEHKKSLKDFLNHCDMVKFAKYKPPVDESDSSFYYAQQLIEQTKPNV